MTYDAFERAVSRGLQGPARLYDLVRDHPEVLEEPEFVDAVTLNLRRGRMLAIVIGDGIRAETEALGDLLQSHAGAHFSFALVELAAWRSPSGDILAVPSTLARTVTIERGIVRVENGVATVHPVPVEARSRRQSISSADFWEKLAERDSALPVAVQSLLTALEPLGVYPDFKASLNLKVDLADRDKPVNLGYITKDGHFRTHPASWNIPERVWRPYFEAVAAMIGGEVVAGSGSESYVSTNGKTVPRIDQFVPKHQDALVAAMERMIRSLQAETA